jgi:hypothetical protein
MTHYVKPLSALPIKDRNYQASQFYFKLFDFYFSISCDAILLKFVRLEFVPNLHSSEIPDLESWEHLVSSE